jgi:hypothetical protein
VKHAIAVCLLLVPGLVSAQPARPTDREALRAQLLTQAREAQSRQDFGVCSSYLEAATAIRSNTEVRYSAALCAFLGGRLPEAQRIAAECLHEREGNPQDLRACQQLLSQVDALEHAPPPPRPIPPAPTPTAATPAPAPSAPKEEPKEEIVLERVETVPVVMVPKVETVLATLEPETVLESLPQQTAVLTMVVWTLPVLMAAAWVTLALATSAAWATSGCK